eukprot:TRINITY_DN22182_c0_g1_i1.p1 TRINITY_DN22182_c0_g1~~TRINITY_DN22182_c0_g1_i1.p1  ORF type:complete len:114 (+),score=24.76 TRINITY_DN22182_c0_g1_i1:65-406(+)
MQLLLFYWWGTIGIAMPEAKRKTVTDNVETLCTNMPIMNAVMTEVSEEDFEDNLKDAGDCYHLAGGRRKRATTRHVKCGMVRMAYLLKRKKCYLQELNGYISLWDIKTWLARI